MSDSQRKVLTEVEILAVACPQCKAPVNMGCRTEHGHVFARRLNADEFSFHALRITTAYELRLDRVLGKKLDATDKALIVYYAYIALCDSVSAKSVEMLGKETSSVDIQRYFAQKAIYELRNDGLFQKHGKAN
jgi:hypothetical protein